MLLVYSRVAVLALASCHLVNALSATILADTNRDGLVDVEGDSDVAGKQTWTESRGGLFLPNIGDTSHRCGLQQKLTDTEIMHLCHDASDNILRQSKYLAPLFTKPISDISSNGYGTLKIDDPAARERVRIFVKEDNDWVHLEADRRFTAAELKVGLRLGIDGRDVRRPNVWDGKVKIYFTVNDGSNTVTDHVELRVAPFLTHHHAQKAQQVFISSARSNAVEKFNTYVTNHSSQAGIESSPILLGGNDIWVQDTFEAGYSSMPGPGGPITIRIMLVSHQRRLTGDSLFKSVRNDDIGAINFPEVWGTDTSEWGDTWDSTGNLETIPPYSHDGKNYPAGRIIMGKGEKGLPLILPFLQLQDTQEPIILDTSFLAVGHVDEFIQFLPANNSRGWVIMADDPLAGMALLRNAAASGHGSERAVSRPVYSWDPYSGIQPPCVPRSTISYELARPDFESAQKYAAEHIQANIDLIKEHTGITDGEIFRVPGLWSSDWRGWNCQNDGGGAKLASAKFSKPKPEDVYEAVDIVAAAKGNSDVIDRRQTGVKVHAHYPSAVNGVVLSNSYYLSPNPWGPIIEGVDIFAEAIKAAYAPLGFSVGFIDTWFTHHQGKGEVHCGTNVWREPDSIWY